MGRSVSFVLLLIPFSLFGQTQEELRFLDTLKMGGGYLLGKPMPGFKTTSLEGVTYSKKSLKRKITIINFWFEACAPCIAESDPLNKLYEKYGKRKHFQFLSFTFEKKENAEKFANKYNIKYPIITTTIDSCYLLNFKKGFPTIIVTNKKGKIAYFTFGGTADPIKAKDFIEMNIYPVLNKFLGIQ